MKKRGIQWLFREFSHSSHPCLSRLHLCSICGLGLGPASAARIVAVPLPLPAVVEGTQLLPRAQRCATHPAAHHPTSVATATMEASACPMTTLPLQ